MRILALTLVAACSYHEPIGTSQLSSDAGASSGFGVDAPIDPHVISDRDVCADLSAYADDVYCLTDEHDDSVSDGSFTVLLRRITADDRVVTDGTLPSAFAFSSLAQDEQSVYLAAELRPESQFVVAQWTIYAFDKQTHTFTALVTGLDQDPRHLVVDDGQLYYFAHDSVPHNTDWHYDQLFSVPIAGGTPTLLTDQLSNVQRATTDGTYVYATDIGRYTVNAISIAAPHTVLTLRRTGDPLDSTATPPLAVHVRGAWLYYSTEGRPNGEIRRVPRPAASIAQPAVSTVDELVAASTRETWQMTSTETHLYWTDAYRGLMSGPLDGGVTEALLTFGGQGYGGIAIAATHVYFAARLGTSATGLIAKYEVTP